jgi:hypothetical protein
MLYTYVRIADMIFITTINFTKIFRNLIIQKKKKKKKKEMQRNNIVSGSNSVVSAVS